MLQAWRIQISQGQTADRARSLCANFLYCLIATDRGRFKLFSSKLSAGPTEIIFYAIIKKFTSFFYENFVRNL